MASFHPFPRLPFEIRAQIWSLTVEPRVVNVRVVKSRLFSKTPVPAALQTCQQARNQGLYQRSFSELADPNGIGCPYVWLNLDIDVVDIGQTMFSLYSPVAATIRRLKFSRENSADWFYYSEVQDLRLFTNVVEIQVLCVDGLCAWEEATCDHYFPCGNENVILIDYNTGRVVKSVDLDEEIRPTHESDEN